MTFSEYLTAHRLTVETLAGMAGVKPFRLWHLTHGSDKWADAPLWYATAVAGALGLNAQDLLDFDKIL